MRACFARCSSSVFPREKAKEKVVQSTSTTTCTCRYFEVHTFESTKVLSYEGTSYSVLPEVRT